MEPCLSSMASILHSIRSTLGKISWLGFRSKIEKCLNLYIRGVLEEKMKKSYKLMLVLLLGSFLLVANSIAAPMNVRPIGVLPGYGGEPSLQDILDLTVGPGVLDVNNQDPSALWNQDLSVSTAIEIAYYTGGGGQLGIYDTIGNEYLLPNLVNDGGLLDSFQFHFEDGDFWGKTTAGPWELIDTGWSETFGFFWQHGSTRGYTEDSENGGSAEALVYYLEDGLMLNLGWYFGNPGSWPAQYGNNYLIAFDNPGGYGDFNDAVTIVKGITPVPEPATLFLIGTGLLGIAGIGRKKIFKK